MSLEPVTFVLMNTAGNSNHDLNEQILFAHNGVIELLRLWLFPHVDDEKAADYLRTQIGQHEEVVEWPVVRPDNLIDERETTEFAVHPSPMRSASFDAGVTSRIHVGCFMADPISDDATWMEWR